MTESPKMPVHPPPTSSRRPPSDLSPTSGGGFGLSPAAGGTEGDEDDRLSPKIPYGMKTGQKIVRLLLRLFVRMDVKGLQYLPLYGPAMITPNHTSWLDVILMAVFSPVPPVTFAADKWDQIPLLNLLFRHFGQAIFVHRGAPDLTALRAALQVLKEKRVLGVAPEGTRSHDGILQQGHDGAAWLAGRTGATIVPVAMWGHEQMTASWVRLRRPLVHMHVGESYRLPPEARKARSKDLPRYTEIIMYKIADMLPPEQRGPYV